MKIQRGVGRGTEIDGAGGRQSTGCESQTAAIDKSDAAVTIRSSQSQIARTRLGQTTGTGDAAAAAQDIIQSRIGHRDAAGGKNTGQIDIAGLPQIVEGHKIRIGINRGHARVGPIKTVHVPVAVHASAPDDGAKNGSDWTAGDLQINSFAGGVIHQ